MQELLLGVHDDRILLTNSALQRCIVPESIQRYGYFKKEYVQTDTIHDYSKNLTFKSYSLNLYFLRFGAFRLE